MSLTNRVDSSSLYSSSSHRHDGCTEAQTWSTLRVLLGCNHKKSKPIRGEQKKQELFRGGLLEAVWVWALLYIDATALQDAWIGFAKDVEGVLTKYNLKMKGECDNFREKRIQIFDF